MNGVDVLHDGDVTVVRAGLDADRRLDHLLSDDEMRRARRFRRTIDQQRYGAARALLRLLLGERLDRDPRAVRIVVGARGKPRLHDVGALGFNIAHSEGVALFAFTGTGEVGIDIEHIRPLDPLLLSRTCFSIAERAELVAIAPQRRLAAFFDGWVRKEAVIKADGRGLSWPLDTFTVTLQGPAELVAVPVEQCVRRWAMVSIDAGPHVRAAIALRH
jgi:4'-phosphopantetheinyl transferase